MRIGVPKEIKTDEYRVALTPAGARELIQRGHEVLVETGAGEGSAFPDEQYERAGARVVSVDDAWGQADLLLNVGQPARAARLLEPLVEAEPENEAAWELLARSSFASAQLGRAEAALRRLVEVAPVNGWARRALARTLERQSRAAEAVGHHRVADALGAD